MCDRHHIKTAVDDDDGQEKRGHLKEASWWDKKPVSDVPTAGPWDPPRLFLTRTSA